MKAEGASREDAESKLPQLRQPTRRLIAPEGVADLIVFLCRPNTRELAGSAMPIDAGCTAN
jgi:3-hydroxybutyrate dehydrogenase